MTPSRSSGKRKCLSEISLSPGYEWRTRGWKGRVVPPALGGEMNDDDEEMRCKPDIAELRVSGS
jgi:hypothetical protein